MLFGLRLPCSVFHPSYRIFIKRTFTVLKTSSEKEEYENYTYKTKRDSLFFLNQFTFFEYFINCSELRRRRQLVFILKFNGTTKFRNLVPQSYRSWQAFPSRFLPSGK